MLHAEQAAQGPLKALLHGVGATRLAVGDSLVDLADACEREAGLSLAGELREALGELAAHYLPARYPDALAGGIPADHYGPAASERAISTARGSLEAAEAHWRLLVQADAAPEGEADTGEEGNSP